MTTPHTPRSAAETLAIVEKARTAGHALRIEATGDDAVGTSGLAEIVEYRPEDLTIAVGAGMSLAALESVLAPNRQTAVLPETTPHRTVGSVVASGSSGYRRLHYGPTRDRVLGATLVTGYGEVVTGGGQLVKNVTGYDLPRLLTGSFGSLGLIVEIVLKLWPVPPVAATFSVGDPAHTHQLLYRPLAVLETEAGSFAYAEGSHATIESFSDALKVDRSDGLQWPEAIDTPVVVSVRVPPRSIADAVTMLRDAGAERWVAQHGVGIVDAGFRVMSNVDLDALRRTVGSVGGVVIVERTPESIGDRWGMRPDAIAIQERMKRLFDPDGIWNPGVLPGSL